MTAPAFHCDAVLFDMDGTLVDSRALVEMMWLRWANRRGVSPEAILADTKQRLAHYKIPKELRVVATVPRAPNGKPDYATAKRLFEQGDVR